MSSRRLGFLAEDVGAEVVPRDSAAYRVFYGNCRLSGDRFVPIKPIPDVRLRLSNAPGEFRLRARCPNGFFQCLGRHARTIQHLL